MGVVLIWTALSVMVAAVAGLLVLGAGLALRGGPASPLPDPLAAATRRAFDRELTQTGRVRIMLAYLAQREAHAAGRPVQARGLHRASV